MRTKQLPHLALLKLFMNPAYFERWRHMLNKEILSNELRILFSDFYVYYRENTCESLPIPEFLTWFSQIRHKKLEKVEYDLYEEMITTASQYEIKDPEVIIKHFRAKELQEKLKEETYKDVFDEKAVLSLIEEYTNTVVKIDYEDLFCRATAEELFHEDNINPVFTYKLNCLNHACGGIYKTDYIMIAAPVHTGKSAFLVDNAIHCAKQTDKTIYYLVNEESKEQVKAKLIKSALLQYKRSKGHYSLNTSFIKNFSDLANSKKQELYEKIIGGSNKIEIVDISGINIYNVTAMLKKLPTPGLVIIDLVSKLGIKDNSEHQQMVQRSEMVKDITKVLEVPVIGAFQGAPGTSWLDKDTGDTKYKHYIHMSDIAGAKNASGPVDVFIGIGRDGDNKYERSIYVSKNRAKGIPYKGWVSFIGEECNYLDM